VRADAAAQGKDQEIEDFKGYVRQKMNALVIDAGEISRA
jgi:hypothetical protein